MVDLPDRSLGIIAVQPVAQKYSASLFAKITIMTCAVPRSSEGRTRRHGRWVRDAVDAAARKTKRDCSHTAKPCGPDAPTLAFNSRRRFFRLAGKVATK